MWSEAKASEIKSESFQWTRRTTHLGAVDSGANLRFSADDGGVHLRLSFPDQSSKVGDELPDYESPPVVELSVGVQFDGLTNYHSLDAGSFWERIKGDFPVIEEMPPLEPAYETFGPRNGAFRQPQLQISPAPIQPRFCFISRDGTELVQLQKDRIFFNWRKVDGAGRYPRYPYVRRQLRDQLGHLYAWAETNRLGEINPTQCEAVYVNRIPLQDADGNQCGLSHFLPWLEGLKGRTEDGAFAFRRRLNDESGRPTARLSFDLRYGTDQMGQREAQLVLLVRGRPAEPDLESSLELIDAEREVIVQTFTDITAEPAHRIWGRRQ